MTRFISHDACLCRSKGASRVEVIEAGSRYVIGASSIVMPHVRMGADTIIAVGSVVTRDIPDGAVATEIRASVIKTTAGLHEKTRARLTQVPCICEDYRMQCGAR